MHKLTHVRRNVGVMSIKKIRLIHESIRRVASLPSFVSYDDLFQKNIGFYLINHF